MYLARVEMSGFKSFADKTVIEFDQGMTAVVGPNGSGKSNLTEAIRWVLGEQSAKSLRGSKMEDVIFNGTQDRKPINIAKVSLVLNNEDRYLDYDHNEIVITRTYHRNGESQYSINKETCRLKDIVDLLLDTGLGKNSFSIISQGQVEQIFLNKPEERRTIFEEAAGVQKYQYRKTEAERKLLRSKDHLSRVKDIIHELNNQLIPLEKQKEDAINYQALKEELKQHEVSLYTYQIKRSKDQWVANEGKLEEQLNQKSLLEKQQIESEQQVHELKLEYQQVIDELDRLNQTYQSVVQKIERNHGEVKILTQQIEFNQSNHQEKESRHLQNVTQLERLNSEIDSFQTDLATLQDEYKSIKEKLTHIENKQNNISDLSDLQIEVLRADLITLYQEKATLNNQIQQCNDLIERNSIRMNQLSDKLQTYQTKEDQLSTELEAMVQKENQLKQLNDQNQAELKGRLDQFQENQMRREMLKQKVFDSERQVNQVKYRMDNIKHSQEDYVGYYAGVRAIMKQKTRIKGIHQPLADIIQVDSRYEVAIDIALGAAAQHIVVDNDLAAKQAIQYLKSERAGRATFLPITNIQARTVNEGLLNQVQSLPGFIDVANQLVQYDEPYHQIVANVLGTTIVVDSIENAQKMANQTQHRLKIVTLDGDILLPGGSITGGKQKNQQQSMLNRQNLLNQITHEFEQSQKIFHDVEIQYRHAEELNLQLEEHIRKDRQQLNQTQQQAFDIHKEIEELRRQLKQLKTDKQIDQSEFKEYQLEIEQSHIQVDDLKTKLDSTQQRMSDIETELNQANSSEEDRRQTIQTLEREMNQWMTQEAVKKLEIQQLKAKINDKQEQSDQLTKVVNDFQNQNHSQHHSLSELQSQLNELKLEIDQQELVAKETHQSILDKRQHRQEINNQLVTMESSAQEINQKLQALYQSMAKLEAQIEKDQTLIDNYLTYLNQEYQLSFEMGEKLAEPIESISKTQDIIRSIKQKIDRLGPINLQAIDDFEELNTRYQTLVTQENELLSAMSQLQATMDEMDGEVISRFGATFNLINEQFQVAFQKLFGGGQASLELTNPKDLLTTGIDIIAQPPGKKKQNLALLSGGERALTAIALLFAILEIKAVPFVVLDEVEAALDDANVYRYGEYIQSFTQQTQFIVITHRKGTMEHADVLYGVTMQQSGVSKMASVKLSQAQEA